VVEKMVERMNTETIIAIACTGVILLIIIAAILWKLKQARNRIIFAQGLVPDPNFKVGIFK
jgi:hypothetical protein